MENKTCHFCPKESHYTCPKCNVPYCSSACYKCQKHLKCSESFYKDLVEEQLKGATASPDSKLKMQEILQKMQQEDRECAGQDDDDDCLDSDDDEHIADRLKGVDLDDSDAVWSKLSENEQREFLDIITDGKTADLIPPWEAWWDAKTSVTEVTEGADKDVPSFMENCPPILDCPPLSQVMKSEPSPTIAYNILNVLSSYVWTVRIFNGDHQESCVDATEAVLTLSPALSAGTCYSSAEIAVNTPKVEAQNHPWLSESEEFAARVQEDVKTILKGPCPSFHSFYISSALSDIHTLFATCKRALSSKKKERSGVFASSVSYLNQEIPRKFSKPDLVQNSIKKIEFYLSFVKEYPYKLSLDR